MDLAEPREKLVQDRFAVLLPVYVSFFGRQRAVAFTVTFEDAFQYEDLIAELQAFGGGRILNQLFFKGQRLGELPPGVSPASATGCISELVVGIKPLADQVFVVVPKELFRVVSVAGRRVLEQDIGVLLILARAIYPHPRLCLGLAVRLVQNLYYRLIRVDH